MVDQHLALTGAGGASSSGSGGGGSLSGSGDGSGGGGGVNVGGGGLKEGLEQCLSLAEACAATNVCVEVFVLAGDR